ncbi:AIF_collapsed_G0021070.mRNA.1.CDS.1 [Saccharomyces cerevisiae]|nr:BLD_1a_G0023770.mRNA.1.CDS.1 [Saccharomyces cerevisiae]CAI4508750.1 CAS_1a_G0023870.mRNA.1.CDS.1 [Saccharomyces cerevisiae]CAI4509094.1 CAS_1a_G0023910.mRNA.1.CDS.1 [Saccharomyces cerevisiae]CAI4525321.1 ALS_1a_G0024330.mRNA.1.CDS.1 [Saccharomyces cerevisiae]CAI4527303.1 ALS_1a_G0024560.mRNA.1.CDS.1 [Saccharomyces cerevisiae]
MKVMSANANVVAAKIMNNAKKSCSCPTGCNSDDKCPCGNKSEETKKSCCSGK